MRRSQLLTSEYSPQLAQLLSPELHSWPVRETEALLRQHLAVDDIESFGRAFKALNRGVAQVSRAVPAAMPVVQAGLRAAAPLLPVAGQIAGTMIGGPAGTMVGGALGNAAAGALAPGRASRAMPTPPTPREVAPMAAPAAGQLLNVLGRPEVLRALLSMALGPAGNPNTRVGATPVPVSAIANLVGSLAQQAIEEYRLSTDGAGEEVPEYLTDSQGNLRCDPGSAEERASVLYGMLTSPDEGESFVSAEADDEEFEWEERASGRSRSIADYYDDVDLGEIWADEAFDE